MNGVLPARQERAIKASAASRRRRKYARMALELADAGYVVHESDCSRAHSPGQYGCDCALAPHRRGEDLE